MEEKTVSKFKWFWAWQDDKEETWLEEMSRQGLHLQSPGLPGMYYFESGEPRDYVYRLDFNNSYKNRNEYLQIFQDAGWKHVGRLGGWDYFRKLRQPGEVMEIYSDKESKIQKYYRLLLTLIIFLPIMIVLLTSNQGEHTRTIYEIGRLLGAVLLVLYSVAMIKILQRINRLKNELPRQ
jgi:Protein of unknown function (DUF2812)